MATKNNPGVFDCYEHADPDEPMFVLLARDVVAADLVRKWADVRGLLLAGRDLDADTLEAEQRQLDEARECADAMDAWRAGAARCICPDGTEVAECPLHGDPRAEDAEPVLQDAP